MKHTYVRLVVIKRHIHNSVRKMDRPEMRSKKNYSALNY